MINISADLPFAQTRFCASESLDNVTNLSVMRGREFLRNYGVEIVDGPLAGLAARAVVLLDRDNVVRHTEMVSKIEDEPNYEAVLKALKALWPGPAANFRCADANAASSPPDTRRAPPAGA